MISYNHERYISEAIESVISQKCDFKIELIIGEDRSTDKTRSICEFYAKKYPDIIKLLPEGPNLGIIPNFIRTLHACSGSYIALCEGDDYWTDTSKLQQQIDFLEQNLDYSASAHQTEVIYEASNRDSHPFSAKSDCDFTLNSLLSRRQFHTASFVFRREILIQDISFPDICAGDRALFILCACFGKIRYFGKSMCVYRKNDGGVSSWVTRNMMKKDLNMIPWIMAINPDFPKYRYLSFIHKTIFEYPSQMSTSGLLIHYFLHIFYSFSFFPKNIGIVLSSTKLFLRRSLKR